MSTETTVLVTCDHCGEEHYHGPDKGRPEHAHVTVWKGSIGWNPSDLCEPCADEFMAMVREFGKPKKTAKAA